jgi:hypothetical protein
VGPGVGLGAVAKRKYPNLRRQSNCGRPTRSLITAMSEVARLRIFSDSEHVVHPELRL